MMSSIFNRRAFFLAAPFVAATLLLTLPSHFAQGQDTGKGGKDKAAAKGKAKGGGPPGRDRPDLIQVLMITGRNPHDWRGETAAIRQTLQESGLFDVRQVDEFRGGTAQMLAPYQLIILNYYDGGSAENANRWGAPTEQAFVDFVRSGKGLIIYHLSIGAFTGWKEYEQMSAGNWRTNKGHHSAPHDWPMDIKDLEHPIMKGFKTPLLINNDELYANLLWHPDASYHLLASAYDDHSLYGANDRQEKIGAGTNEPILWTTQFGNGRVFVDALGHEPFNTTTPEFKTILLRGAEWAATGKVTIPIPPELAAK
jgi:type 1 glutamine amidotransferase